MSYHFRDVHHHLDALPDELTGIVLPTPSQAVRDVPAASSAHCTAHSVLGDGAGIRMQHESHLEIDSSYILNSVRNVASMDVPGYRPLDDLSLLGQLLAAWRDRIRQDDTGGD